MSLEILSTGSTRPILIGGRLRMFPYHDLKGSSMVTYIGAVGDGTSPKALMVTAPNDVYPLSAVKTQKLRAPA